MVQRQIRMLLIVPSMHAVQTWLLERKKLQKFFFDNFVSNSVSSVAVTLLLDWYKNSVVVDAMCSLLLMKKA